MPIVTVEDPMSTPSFLIGCCFRIVDGPSLSSVVDLEGGSALGAEEGSNDSVDSTTGLPVVLTGIGTAVVQSLELGIGIGVGERRF